MQRQSLGSPASKLQINGGKEEKLEKEENRKDVEEDDEKKVDKHLRSSSRTQKSVHLIPVLTIFCFLVLYLVSHDPSQNDLANAGGFERHFRPKDLKEVSDVHRFFDLEKNQLLAIRSHRSLQEVGKGARKSRPLNRHRKFGSF
ncbi:uncharacterized protein LOC131233741 [Magnolia sinica]|uniref:uncharacterized protein LOC131233741 n=1 Tax=Magnolia sinica TaxID=86752 RepID=UPI0026596B01|nr:uncharacterized protein LOC131233741 [Magnolia sinica]